MLFSICKFSSSEQNSHNYDQNAMSSFDDRHKICEICEDVSEGRHFGVMCCHACAAFFRRTVTDLRVYECRRLKNCILKGVYPRQMCKYCRYKKCIIAGMKMPSTQNNNIRKLSNQSQKMTFNHIPLKSHEESLLSMLVFCRKSLLFDRIRFGMFENHNIDVQEGKRAKNIQTLKTATLVECKVFQSFLHSSGMLDEISDVFNNLDVFKRVLPNWLIMESILATLRHHGHEKNRLFSINEEYIEIEEEFLTSLFLTDNDIKHAKSAAILEAIYFKDYLRIASCFKRFNLDEYEIAALIQMSILKYVSLLVKPQSKQYLSIESILRKLFKDLSTYYSDNYEQMAIRFDFLSSALGQILELRTLHDHHRITMELNGYEDPTNKIIRPTGKENGYLEKNGSKMDKIIQSKKLIKEELDPYMHQERSLDLKNNNYMESEEINGSQANQPCFRYL